MCFIINYQKLLNSICTNAMIKYVKDKAMILKRIYL